MAMVRIFGKENCPYTTAAREAHEAKGDEVAYYDVKRDAARLAEMLVLSGGRREVPVLDESGTITIGFGGT